MTSSSFSSMISFIQSSQIRGNSVNPGPIIGGGSGWAGRTLISWVTISGEGAAAVALSILTARTRPICLREVLHARERGWIVRAALLLPLTALHCHRIFRRCRENHQPVPWCLPISLFVQIWCSTVAPRPVQNNYDNEDVYHCSIL